MDEPGVDVNGVEVNGAEVNGAVDETDRKARSETRLSLLWTTCPDLTGRQLARIAKGYRCFGECSLITESLVDKTKPANQAAETVGGGR